MREWSFRYRKPEAGTNRLPAIARVPLDQPTSRSRSANILVMALVSGDCCGPSAPITCKAPLEQLADHLSVPRQRRLIVGYSTFQRGHDRPLHARPPPLGRVPRRERESGRRGSLRKARAKSCRPASPRSRDSREEKRSNRRARHGPPRAIRAYPGAARTPQACDSSGHPEAPPAPVSARRSRCGRARAPTTRNVIRPPLSAITERDHHIPAAKEPRLRRASRHAADGIPGTKRLDEALHLAASCDIPYSASSRALRASSLSAWPAVTRTIWPSSNS